MGQGVAKLVPLIKLPQCDAYIDLHVNEVNS